MDKNFPRFKTEKNFFKTIIFKTIYLNFYLKKI